MWLRRVILGSVLATSLLWAAAKERPLYDERFFEPVEEIVSPHLPWAKPYLSPPKVLFLTHRNAMREAIEIAQRLSLDYAVFAMEGPKQFGETGEGVDAAWRLIRGNSAAELAERLRQKLAAHYDVYVLGGIDWSQLPLDCRYEILRAVKAGAGLVGCLRGQDPYLQKILKTAELGWKWGVWVGAAQGIPDYFGQGVFAGAVDYAGGHSGQAALRIECQAVTPGKREAARAGFLVEAIALEPNTEYLFSMWTRTRGLQDGQALVSLYPLRVTVPVPAREEWTYTEQRFRTGPEPAKTGIYLLLYQPGVVWFDDLRLVKVGTEENLLPNPSFEYPGPAPQELGEGFAWRTLPAFQQYADTPTFLRSVLQTTRFGRGRIGLVTYNVPTYQMLTPGPSGPVQYCREDYEEYLQWALRLILWGAQKSPPVQIVTEKAEAPAGQALQLSLRLRSREAVPHATIAVLSRPSFFPWDRRAGAQAQAGNRGSSAAPGAAIERAVTTDLKAGDNVVVVPLGPMPAGGQRLALQLRAGGKVIGFGSVAVEIHAPTTIKSVELARPTFSVKEPIAGRLVVQGPTKGLAVRLAVFDQHGRLLGEQTKPLTGQEIAFQLPLVPPTTIVGWLRVELREETRIIATTQKDFTFYDFYPKRDDIQFIMWQGYSNTFLHPLIAETFTRYGIDAFYDGGNIGYGPYANQHWIPYATRFVDQKTDWYQPRPTRQPGDLVRDPCLTNPDYRREVAETLTKCAERARQWGTLDFTLGDENHFVAGAWDLCFSDTCRADFRRWAKETYGTLEKLNAEWGGSFRSWDEVEPQTLEEAKKKGNLVPWVDHRLHMETVWAGIHAYARNVIRQAIPQARVGYEGSDTEASSWQADDYWQLAQAMDLNNIYYRDFLSLAVRDFSSRDTLLGGGWFGGYASNRNAPFMRWFPWRTLFKGANSFWVWMGYGSAGSVMAFDVSLYPFFRAACEEIAEIKRGIGKALMHAERQHDGVAILWSNASVHLATATPGFPPIDPALNATVALLHDCGLEGKVVSYQQVREGLLRRGNFKALLLVEAQALSPVEVAEIRQFVASGGTVIADLRPGVTDEHGKPYAPPALDDLFGVAQGPAFQRVSGTLHIGTLKLENAIADGSLRVREGTAEGKIGETPVLIRKAHGKGQAVLLNFSLADYAKLPHKEGEDFAGWAAGEGYREFFSRVLAEAGVRPVVTITPPRPRVEVARFAAGGILFVGVLQGLPRDPMEYTNRVAPLPKAEPTTIHFGRRAYLYDVRRGKYLGLTDSVRTPLTPGIAQLYALLPYRVERLEIGTPPQARAGEAVRFSIRLQTAGRTAAQTHALHVEILGPDGQARLPYAQNLLTQREAAGKPAVALGQLPLALNDPAGVWTIVARDIASGVTGRARLRVISRR